MPRTRNLYSVGYNKTLSLKTKKNKEKKKKKKKEKTTVNRRESGERRENNTIEERQETVSTDISPDVFIHEIENQELPISSQLAIDVMPPNIVHLNDIERNLLVQLIKARSILSTHSKCQSKLFGNSGRRNKRMRDAICLLNEMMDKLLSIIEDQRVIFLSTQDIASFKDIALALDIPRGFAHRIYSMFINSSDIELLVSTIKEEHAYYIKFQEDRERLCQIILQSLQFLHQLIPNVLNDETSQ